MSTDLTRLNVGCGEHPRKGYIGIDRKHGGEAHPLAFNDGTPVPNEYADEIRASHVLEHFSHTATANVLQDWIRALKPGGILKLAVPNFEWIAREYLEGEDDPEKPVPLIAYLMGGHTDENDIHGAIFDGPALTQLLEDLGLEDVQPWEGDPEDCSGLPVSLNLQARKPLPKQEGEGSPFDWLGMHGANRYSQYGEDGALEAVFGKIGTTNRWCIECGAGDGIRYSNTRKLIEEGWNAVLIEKDPAAYERLCQGIHALGFAADIVPFAGTKWERAGQCVWTVWAVASASGDTSLDNILADAGCPNEPDLMVLDVDGQDYYLWNGLLHYQPRVVLCEFDQFVEPGFIPPPDGLGQAGKQAILSVAYTKSMRPIAQLGVNMLFVRAPLLQAVADRPVPIATRHPIGEAVAAVMSVPRLLWADNMHCALKALVPLGVTVEQTGGVFWEQSLTQVIEPHLEDGTRYVLTLDYDTLFTKADVLALFRLMEEHPDVDALVSLQMQQTGAKVLFTITDRAGVPRQNIRAEEMRQELVPIRTGHFGLTMIRMESLRKLPRPWFLHQPDSDGRWGAGRCDSDVFFWTNAEKAGWKVCLAARVVIGHLVRTALWPSRSLEPVYQRVEDFHKDGKPEEAWR